MTDVHRYGTTIAWQGSTGAGYDRYDRGHEARTVPATTVLALSSDPAFRGDPTRLNPEQLLVLAASSCQLLSFLAVAARARLDVVSYADEAEAEMPDDGGRDISITRIVLRPRVVVIATGPDPSPLVQRVERLLHLAHGECYIANSLRTQIVLEPVIEVVPTGQGRVGSAS